MTEAGPPGQGSPVASSATFAARLVNASRAAGPPLLFGLRLWVSVCLALYFAFWLELDNTYWAGTTAAFDCQPQLGASQRKGWFRMIGTVAGAVAILVLTACFPQDRVAFLAGLALGGSGCAFVVTILRNFLALAAQLAGITAAIIASSQLGATGGANGEAFMLAVIRCTEICVGIVSAGAVLAGTDFGSASRRLATLIADISTEVMRRFVCTLALAGPELPETRPMRQERIRRVVELDPIIEEAIRESSQLRPHSPVLAMAVGGLLAAVASWRVVAVHFAQLPHDQARQEAATVLQAVPKELLSEPEREEPARWIADPIGLGSNGHRRIIGTQISGSVDKLRTLVCHITQTDNFVTS
jgi:fusaric acid resistance family protein